MGGPGGVHARRPAGAGPVPGVDGLLVAAGFSGHGFGALTARPATCWHAWRSPGLARRALGAAAGQPLRHDDGRDARERPGMISIFALSGGYLELGRETMVRDAPPSRWTVPIECFLVTQSAGSPALRLRTALRHPEEHAGPLRRGARPALRDPLQAGRRRRQPARRLGLAPSEVAYVANSHWHFDHCGGNEFFPDATILVQDREMKAARSPRSWPRGGTRPSVPDYEHPWRYQAVDASTTSSATGRWCSSPPTATRRPPVAAGAPEPRQAASSSPPTACYTARNMDRDVPADGVVGRDGDVSLTAPPARAARQAGRPHRVRPRPEQWSTLPHAPASFV